MLLLWLPWVLLLRQQLLQAVVRQSKEDRGNAAAGDLGEGG